MATDTKYRRYFNCLSTAMLAACGLAATPQAFAAKYAEVTIQVVDSEDYAEETLVSQIKLPDIASPKAHENAASGLETANEARLKGREFGRERAAAARELGREIRRGTPDLPVPGMPDAPGRPDSPGRPDVPGKPDMPGKPDN